MCVCVDLCRERVYCINEYGRGGGGVEASKRIFERSLWLFGLCYVRILGLKKKKTKKKILLFNLSKERAGGFNLIKRK